MITGTDIAAHMNKRYGSFVKYWLPVLGYGLILFYLASKPGPDYLPKFHYADKAFHFGAFIILGILFFRAFGSLNHGMTPWGVVVLSLVSSAIFGACIEVNQLFLPYRQAEVWDLAADILGSFFGIMAVFVTRLTKRGAGAD